MTPPFDREVKAQFEALANQMRRIINRLAVVRPPADELARATEVAAGFADHLEGLAERKRSWEVSEAGLRPRDFVAFSPLSGRANPMAPPVKLRVIDDGDDAHHVEGTVTFGPAYEGPPGHVHGGFVAAMFDELLGFAQLAPGFTAYLKVDYRKPTPLNTELTLRAGTRSLEGRKRLLYGTCHVGDLLTAEAEGLFVAPRSGEDYLQRLGVTAK